MALNTIKPIKNSNNSITIWFLKCFWNLSQSFKYNWPGSHLEFLNEMKVTNNVYNNSSNFCSICFQIIFGKKFEIWKTNRPNGHECVVVVRQLFSPTVRESDSSIVRHNGSYSTLSVARKIRQFDSSEYGRVATLTRGSVGGLSLCRSPFILLWGNLIQNLP